MTFYSVQREHIVQRNFTTQNLKIINSMVVMSSQSKMLVQLPHLHSWW